MTSALTDLNTGWLRRLKPVARPWVRLVCLPHAGGTAYSFRSWRDALPPDVELYAVQYPGRLERSGEPWVTDMHAMADRVTDALRPLLDRPVALLGHSVGAALGYEVARRLPARTGHRLARLFVSGRPAPDRQREASTHLADDDVLWGELRRLGGASREVCDNPELREAFLPILRHDYRLDETYQPRPGPPLSCPVTALLGERDSEVDADEARAWARYTTDAFSMRVFPGDHFYLHPPQPALVAEVADRIAEIVPRYQPDWAGP